LPNPNTSFWGRTIFVSLEAKNQIQGWKEIAAYFARNERTVKRWEKVRGLPVRRIPGQGRANVYILVSDLEDWLDPETSHGPRSGEQVADRLSVDLPRSVAAEDRVAATMPYEAGHAIPDAGSNPGLDMDQVFGTITNPVNSQPNTRPRVSRSISFLFTLAIFATVLVVIAVRVAGSGIHAEAKPTPPSDSRSLVSSSLKSAAEDTYLQAVYLYEERTPASLDRAHYLFSDAIAKDPNYAPAYAGLANTYLLLREYSSMSSDEAYAKAKLAAQRAVALDPNLPEAHASLGFIDFFSDWNTAAATREFETALRLDPDCGIAHHWYGSMLMHETRYPEAIEQLDVAQRLHPASSAILTTKAYALGLGGHRDQAERMLQTVIAADPKAASPHQMLATLSLTEPRNIQMYLRERRRSDELRNDHEDLTTIGIAAAAYRREGEPAMWSTILGREQHLHGSPDHPTYGMAQAEASLGHSDQALHDLNTLATQHAPSMMGVALDPAFVALRRNPGYQRLLSSIGLLRTF
jgi:Tfp pilus assembly protein PilF